MVKIDKLYCSISEACIRYGICRSKIYELLKNEECPEVKRFGKKVLIPISSFDKFFDSQLETYQIRKEVS
ncbi:MAG TPA: helix-turn-helix domain-containing protein [Clostridiales bacterium]|nr:helix-turn-helix domain-containing protein [Clostridiales bacterium]